MNREGDDRRAHTSHLSLFVFTLSYAVGLRTLRMIH